jgi:hypothetical protein
MKPGIKHLWWLASLGALGYGMLTARANFAGAGTEDVAIEPEHVALFDLKEGEKRTIHLRVVNHGTETKSLRVWGTCACTLPQTEHVRLDGGQTQDIPVVIDTMVAPGGNTALVFVESAERRRIASASVSFKSHRDYVMTPGVYSVAKGDSVAGRVRLCGLAEGDTGRRQWAGCVASADTEDLECRLLDTETRCATLALTAKPACAVGVHRVWIRTGDVVNAAIVVGVRDPGALVTVGVTRPADDGVMESWIEGRSGWVPQRIVGPQPFHWEKLLDHGITRIRIVRRPGSSGPFEVLVTNGGQEQTAKVSL